VIYYLDTSALVKRYYTEKGSARVHSLFQAENLLVVSKVAYAELLAAWRGNGGTRKLEKPILVGLWGVSKTNGKSFLWSRSPTQFSQISSPL